MKDFTRWSQMKEQLDALDRKYIPIFHEREIWWCSVGLNVGYEVYGKGSAYRRPVLILKKHNKFTFYGLPLGSTTKQNSYHHPITINQRRGSILLSQGRTYSGNRLSNRIVKLPESQFEMIVQAYKNQY